MNDQLLKNRKLRIDISTNAGSGGDRGNRGDRFNNRNDNRYNNRDDDGEDRTQGKKVFRETTPIENII